MVQVCDSYHNLYLSDVNLYTDRIDRWSDHDPSIKVYKLWLTFFLEVIEYFPNYFIPKLHCFTQFYPNILARYYPKVLFKKFHHDLEKEEKKEFTNPLITSKKFSSIYPQNPKVFSEPRMWDFQ